MTESTGGETDDGEDSDAEKSLGTGSNRGQRRSKTPRSSGHSTAGASAWKYGPGRTGKSRWKVHVCPYPDCNHTAEGYLSRMRRHVLTVHEHKNIACTVCKKTYNSRHYMQSHRYKIHGQQSPEKSKAEWRATYEEWLASEPKKKKKWTNPESDSESERERKWKELKKACKLCGKSISKSNFHRHMKMRHEETSTNPEEQEWRLSGVRPSH